MGSTTLSLHIWHSFMAHIAPFKLNMYGKHTQKESTGFSHGCCLLTADKLMARNWPCNPVCPLCNNEAETATHMCLHCPFALLVWSKVAIWTMGLISVPTADSNLQEWWANSITMVPKAKKRTVAAMLIYTTWNLWKERNRRIFEGVRCSLLQVFSLIKEEVALRQRACGAPMIE
uniref:Reverse transcriptase zinc-binding domain-containing protein n=1 Tax=Setaria viridis TaxID=4556 RepID=A0A4U6VLW0_SETVI|nr:hypothetical protein SEVIR_3G408950v2 [Setaria viridis]